MLSQADVRALKILPVHGIKLNPYYLSLPPYIINLPPARFRSLGVITITP